MQIDCQPILIIKKYISRKVKQKNQIERLNCVGCKHLNCNILNCNHKLQQKLVYNNLETNDFPPKKKLVLE